MLLTGCRQQPAPGPLAEYYYQPAEPGKAKVYHYVPVSDTAMSDEYRLMTSNGPGLLRAVIYDEGGNALQWYEETFRPSGVVMNELHLAGSAGASQAEIMHDDIFPFEAQQNGIFLYRVKWEGSGTDSLRYELIRNRIFLGDTTIAFQGRQLPAIMFRVRDLIETEQRGILSLESDGLEIYGLHTGLVYYRKTINDEKELSYRLSDITTPEKIKSVRFISPWE